MLEFVTPDGKLVTLRGLAIQPRPSSLRARIADGTLMPYPEGFVKGTVKGVAEILLKQERLSLAYRHRVCFVLVPAIVVFASRQTEI